MKIKKFPKIHRLFVDGICDSKEGESCSATRDENEFERCVLCGMLTFVPKSMPIEWRENYEIGCGQNCSECAKKKRKAFDAEDILTNAQIMQAVEQSRMERKE